MPHGRRPQLPGDSFGLALWSLKKVKTPTFTVDHWLTSPMSLSFDGHFLINPHFQTISDTPTFQKNMTKCHWLLHPWIIFTCIMHPFEIVSEGVGKAVGRQSLGMSLSTRPYVLTSWIAHLAGTGSCQRPKKQTSAIPKAASVPWFHIKNLQKNHGFIEQNLTCSFMFPLNPIQWPAETSEPFVADLIDLAFADWT